MFEKILVIYSGKLAGKHLRAVEKIKNIIEKLGKKCTLVKAIDLKQSYFQNIQLVITAGGDGTFIKASNFLKDTLILGINSEPEFSEGALTSLKEDEIQELKNILQGDYKIIKRQRIAIKKNNIIINNLALNEVYVGSSAQFHTSRYIIKFKNKKEEQRSSGVLIVTGSGSNAWYKSAGGVPFNHDERKLKFLVREPYFGKRIFKPKILLGEILASEKIIFEAKRHEGGIIAIDANVIHDFNIPDRIEISLSDTPLNVIVKK